LEADAQRCAFYCYLRGSEIELMYGLDFHARCKCKDGVDMFMPRSGYEGQVLMWDSWCRPVAHIPGELPRPAPLYSECINN
jgi:hypothetical protein